MGKCFRKSNTLGSHSCSIPCVMSNWWLSCNPFCYLLDHNHVMVGTSRVKFPDNQCGTWRYWTSDIQSTDTSPSRLNSTGRKDLHLFPFLGHVMRSTKAHNNYCKHGGQSSCMESFCRGRIYILEIWGIVRTPYAEIPIWYLRRHNTFKLEKECITIEISPAYV